MSDNPADDLRAIQLAGKKQDRVMGSSPVVGRLKDAWDLADDSLFRHDMVGFDGALKIIQQELCFDGKMGKSFCPKTGKFLGYKLYQDDDNIAEYFQKKLNPLFKQIKMFKEDAGDTGETDEYGDPIWIYHENDAKAVEGKIEAVLKKKAEWLRSKAHSKGLYTKSVVENMDAERLREER
jgi:hypothetical protein